MKKVRVAINGFGRIGRNALKVALGRSDMEIVAINDLTDPATLAHLLKYDSTYGVYERSVEAKQGALVIDDVAIKVLSQKDPAALPWRELDIDIVIESTGFFTKPEAARAHIEAGAKRVVLSGPAKGDGAETIVLGVNDEAIKHGSEIVSNASCTTNCIAPVMSVLESEFGVEKSMMTTIHSYTSTQKLLDAPAKNPRVARAAAENIIPTTTGASKATGLVLPSLKDNFDGLSIRVPSPVVSLSDITAVLKRDVTIEEVNAVFREQAKKPYFQGILGVTDEELVSSDFRGNSHSTIVDLPLTNVVAGNLVKVVAWYDNEWGYSNRLVELVADIGKTV